MDPATPPTPPQASPQPEPVAQHTPDGVPSVPAEWPGAFGLYKHSKKAVQYNLGNLVMAWLLTLVVDVVLRVALGSVGQIIEFPISILFMTFMIYMYLAGIRGQKIDFGDGLSKSLSLWLNMFILYIIVAFSIIASILLLVIPFFFVFPRLVLANYFLVDKDMAPLEAYKASWHATKGNAGKVYGIIGVNILIALLAVTIIGFPFAIYFFIMYGAASALLYTLMTRPVAAPTA